MENSTTQRNQDVTRRTVQARYWMLTIPYQHYVPYLPPGVSWIKGQLELGEGGFLHWQLVLSLPKKGSLVTIRRIFGEFHAEATRSVAAEEYVWKDESSVVGTRFELGRKLFQRNNVEHWDAVWELAKAGKLEEVDSAIRVQHYRTLRAIRADYSLPVGMVRTCRVYWGATGTGKSRRAWEEAGSEAYPKDPQTKFWCGYQGQENVVIDEFRGSISVSHFLRWLDRYPVNVEVKGSSLPLQAKQVWITSNQSPDDWWPDIDHLTLAAVKRRMVITQF